MDEQEYKAQKKSSEWYQRAATATNAKDRELYQHIGSLWSLAVERKNPGGWRVRWEEAQNCTARTSLRQRCCLRLFQERQTTTRKHLLPNFINLHKI